MNTHMVECWAQGCKNMVEAPVDASTNFPLCSQCESKFFRKATKETGMRFGI
jgi:hypothetical protein